MLPELVVGTSVVPVALAVDTLAVVLEPDILAVGTLVEPVVLVAVEQLAADTSAVAVVLEPDIPVVAEQLAEPGLAVDKLAVVEQLAVGTLVEPVVLEQSGTSVAVEQEHTADTLAVPVPVPPSAEQVDSSLPS